MKKILSVLLCLTMIFSLAIPAVFAQDTEPQTVVNNDTVFGNGEYPIIFTTGIGQSFSYYLDDEGSNTMIHEGKEYKYIDKDNIFLFEFSKILENADISDYINIGVVAVQLIRSLITDKYSIDYDRLQQLARTFLFQNIIDENGKLPDHIFTPRYNCPISEYPDTGTKDYGKRRFYNEVPCEDFLKEYGEEKVFCYHYAPFGNISDVSKGLDEYINDVVLKRYPDAEKVVLVPMSMGAAMVSQYLYDYGYKEQVARVVSIVGCWDGSDIIADLIEGKFIENSEELFYNELVPMLAGDFFGNLVNIILHLFSKENLSVLVRDAFGAICDEFVLKTPTLLALIPSDRYDAIREKYLTREGYEDVLAQLDAYHDAQSNLKERMKKLNEEQGIDFFFISGYNLKYGAGIGSGYGIFEFMNSSNKVNSDEIINIESTAPGTTNVPAGQQFSEEYLASADPKYISPDKSVDVSTCYYPDRCWLFEGQKHELEDNNVAINLAFEIAKGNITSTADCEDIYPQFNGSRDAEQLKKDIEDLTAYLNDDKVKEVPQYIEDCKNAIEKGKDILKNTILTDREKEDIEIAEIHSVYEEIYNYINKDKEKSEKEIKEERTEKIMNFLNT